jgi:hypothetical protein
LCCADGTLGLAWPAAGFRDLSRTGHPFDRSFEGPPMTSIDAPISAKGNKKAPGGRPGLLDLAPRQFIRGTTTLLREKSSIHRFQV